MTAKLNYHFILICCSLLLFSCSKDDVAPIEDVHTVMLAQVNKLRREGCQCGPDLMPPVHELKWNTILEVSAQVHANDMNTKHYFEHIAPDGTSPIERAMAAGYTGLYVGENIAEGYKTVSNVMTAWKNSEEHCRAMMDTVYYEMGASRAGDYWVQEFGRPVSLPVKH